MKFFGRSMGKWVYAGRWQVGVDEAMDKIMMGLRMAGMALPIEGRANGRAVRENVRKCGRVGARPVHVDSGAGRFLRNLLLVAAGLASWLACVGSAMAIEVVHAEFGLLTPRQAGAAGRSQDLTLEPTRVIPCRTGTRYGWAIELRTDKRRVSVREDYLLPASARSRHDNSHANGHGGGLTQPAPSAPALADAETRTLTFERRNTVSQRQLVPRNGLIFGEWEIGPHEPPGRRHLQVIVEGEVAADFEYEVRAEP